MAQLICKRNSVGYSLFSQRFLIAGTEICKLRLKSVAILKIWNILPSNNENSRTLREFSKKVSHGFVETVLVESMKITYIE